MPFKKNITVDVELTPEECAAAFAHSDAEFQAKFLNELGRLAELPQGHHKHSWWEYQCLSIVQDEGVPKLTPAARYALQILEYFTCHTE